MEGQHESGNPSARTTHHIEQLSMCRAAQEHITVNYVQTMILGSIPVAMWLKRMPAL